MAFEQFLEAANRVKAPEEVFALYQNALADYGFDRVIYSALADHPVYDSVASPAVIKNYPEDWMKYYVEKGYIQLDPVRRMGIRCRLPFTWDQMAANTKLSKQERLVMDEAREAGLRDGIGIAMHGPYGEIMGVGVASSLGGTDPARHLAMVHALTVQFHTVYTALSMTQLEAVAPVRLTAREAEILKWAAAGKSNGVIADILKISEHGVDFHMRNILTKLDADSRLTAVVKAYRLNLIQQ